jgi:RNA polymerase sigma factor (sigma-70 family)
MLNLASNVAERGQDVALLLPLMGSMAKEIERRWSLPAGMDREDLIDEGVVALLRARGRFDPTRGCSFMTFGSYAARGAMLDRVRQRWTTLNREAPLEDDVEAVSLTSCERAVLQREVLRALVEHLSSHDQVLVLDRVEGESVRSLGRRLRMSPVTVHRRYHKAIATVRWALMDSGRAVECA